VTGLPARIVAVHDLLAAAQLPHAFGGALALAWCTQRARGTIDIDVNVFVPADRAGDVLEALASVITPSEEQHQQLLTDGQSRLWWEATPVDVFLDTTPFHAAVGERIRWEPFGDVELPFLACRDLAVFKAFFDRPRDWADLEEMSAAGTLDIDVVVGVLVRYLGADDLRVARLLSLGS
jgi:hypothetical protein